MNLSTYMSCYTDRNDSLVYEMTAKVVKDARKGDWDDKRIYAALRERMAILEAAVPEIGDTEVRACIIGTLERGLNKSLSVYF